jgi:hypothetical protein
MWPFTKKRAFLGEPVPEQPHVRVGEVRRAYVNAVSGPVAFDGPFPLLTDQGIYICKSCGVPFDNWNLSSAFNGLREAVLDPSADVAMFVVNCRKCSTISVFSAKDIVTGQAGDPTGPWTAHQIGVAERSLTEFLKLSPVEVSSLSVEHLRKVFYLYA